MIVPDVALAVSTFHRCSSFNSVLCLTYGDLVWSSSFLAASSFSPYLPSHLRSSRPLLDFQSGDPVPSL